MHVFGVVGFVKLSSDLVPVAPDGAWFLHGQCPDCPQRGAQRMYVVLSVPIFDRAGEHCT